ncbi:DHA2 family efflux MFS transporter permease subunit [Pseudonocardia sp. MH-G8]|uniref:DHA2 family efflux MFS transporter permease subunit n=1 Tax=Pseudonocardia sp. MH-G8 TaxID=1854588 RepID=UPI000BA138AB|nr:DHA2 family efflux MFS transporter permease subunit [Pseudonocardia sp. MH-G8]OZM78956.1 MFS transporter [Pseudonocardia sp. MH-G8]
MTDVVTVWEAGPSTRRAAGAERVRAAHRAKRPGGGWFSTLLVVTLGSFLAALDTSSVNVALPSIERALSAGADDGRWVSTGYSLAMGVAIPLSKWLSDRIGITRLYILCLVVFTGGSALCGLSWDIGSMIAFRLLQGVPGGLLGVLGMTLLFATAPREKIGMAMGLYGLGIVVAPGVGPAMGGWFVENSTWQMIFFAKIPIGIAVVLAAWKILPRTGSTSRPPFDLWGFVTIAVALTTLLMATAEGNDWGWTSYPTVILLIVSLLAFALFVVVENEVDTPLLDLKVFLSRTYSIGLLIVVLVTTAMFGSLFYIPQLLLGVMGLNALEAGLVMMPSALAMAAMAPVAGRVYDRFGARLPVFCGLALTTFACVLMAQVTTNVSESDVIWWSVLFNVGVGLSMMPAMSVGMNALPPDRIASGSALNQVAIRSVSALAVAGLGAVLTILQAQLMVGESVLMHTGPAMPPTLARASEEGGVTLRALYAALQLDVAATAFADIFLVLGGCAAIGALLGLLLPGRKRAGSV